ncbi:MAG: thiamine phosphate synthase [Armatimonadetes bacterium]|nr:thiamine phosphate synthase [Armatimonadota bacterium]NIM24030.1 thiamine phosphate synthase [Armatimonadota bacterium]NIM67880.1 thiamine phosphate synthase [Armatimonadota bacterium]NIM76408.1 thiamine phosphate synthase [Armatimonadota bacterium]NIN06110.1 thiamine phosphate synthase [Armatimonadota bacterium]
MSNSKPRVQGLYVITQTDPAKKRTHIDVARAALEGGAAIIQLRDKEATTRELLKTARNIRELTRQAGALFFVNDRLDVALAAKAEGVHLGEDDMPVAIARGLAGDRLIIGASVSTPKEAVEAERTGADYLGIGSIFPTPSKKDAGPPRGVGIIRQVKAVTKLPVIAIGGINADNAGEVLEAGADGIAVISAISGAEDMTAATANLVRLVGQYRVKS